MNAAPDRGGVHSLVVALRIPHRAGGIARSSRTSLWLDKTPVGSLRCRLPESRAGPEHRLDEPKCSPLPQLGPIQSGAGGYQPVRNRGISSGRQHLPAERRTATLGDPEPPHDAQVSRQLDRAGETLGAQGTPELPPPAFPRARRVHRRQRRRHSSGTPRQSGRRPSPHHRTRTAGEREAPATLQH